MLYLSIFILFLAVFVFLYGLLMMVGRDRLNMADRIEQIDKMGSVNNYESDQRSFADRAIKPFYQAIANFFSKGRSAYKIEQLNRRLERAGFIKKYTAERWILNKILASALFSLIAGLLTYTVEPDLLKTGFIILVVSLLIDSFFNFSLSSRITSRKNELLKALPYTLDLITVSVEAGLSFDGAIARVITNIEGELCDEFGKTLKEIRMGIERKIALKNMSERCDVREISTLLTSLIQADELGVSLGKVLRIEAAGLREGRKQAARAKAMKAPIKMLFPLLFFIFPSIFIIILGPAVIRIIDIF